MEQKGELSTGSRLMALAFLLVCTHAAGASVDIADPTATATRAPPGYRVDNIDRSISVGGVAEVNATRQLYIATTGASSLGWALADATDGIQKSFARFSLDREVPDSHPDFQDVRTGASASSSIKGLTRLSGPAGSKAVITASFTFDGSFSSLVDKPSVALVGSLTIDREPGIFSDYYESRVVFGHPSYRTSLEVIATGTRYEAFELTNEEGTFTTFYDTPLDSATPTVQSATPDRLIAIATVAFEIEVGKTFEFETNLAAAVAANESFEFSTTSWGALQVTKTTLVPSSGQVDASGTGRLSFVLPAGYQLEGGELFDRTVTVVPEPGTQWLLLLGLGALIWGRSLVASGARTGAC